jgi:DNA repair photolyase
MFGQDEIHDLSIEIIDYLNKSGIPCAVLTKGVYPVGRINDPDKINSYGITLVSIDKGFRKKYEPGAAGIEEKISSLKQLHDLGYKTWVSMEPYPTPNIIEQDLLPILERVGFVDRIIFGKMNYNPVATAFAGNAEFYKDHVDKVIGFCKINGIDWYIKDGTV